MRVLALDPGTVQTGFVEWDGAELWGSGVLPNDEMLQRVVASDADRLALEMVASYGMAVGREVFETCVWIGRFQQSWHAPADAMLVYRAEVKMHLCGNTKAKDTNIRQAMLDLFPRTGGGKTPQVGTKNQPGPLFGVSSHAWPALGVAMVVMEKIKNETAGPTRKRPAPRRVPLR